MHPVRLLLLSVLLAAGCAADDSVGTIADVSRATPASSVAQEAPTLAAGPDGTISTGTPGTAAAPANSTASATVTDSTDTTTETATAPADTPTETATAPADTTTETTTTETTTTETPTIAVSSTASADTSTTTSTTVPDSAVTTTVPDSAVSTTVPSQPPIDGFTVFYEATCDVCHGASRQGGSGADLSVSTLNIEAVIEVIRFGVPDTQMEGWDFEPKPPGLTTDEIEAVAVYVMSLRNE